MFLFRVIDGIPLCLVMVLGSLDLLRRGSREDSFLWDVFECRRHVIRIATGIGEQLGNLRHVKLKGIVPAEINNQSNAAFSTLRTVFVFVAMLGRGGCL